MTNAIETKAKELGAELVRLWNNYSDENSNETDLAMRETTKEIRALDLRQVDGVLASPLNYWTRAELDDENPEDLTFCEMIESIEISLGLMREEVP